MPPGGGLSIGPVRAPAHPHHRRAAACRRDAGAGRPGSDRVGCRRGDDCQPGPDLAPVRDWARGESARAPGQRPHPAHHGRPAGAHLGARRARCVLGARARARASPRRSLHAALLQPCLRILLDALGRALSAGAARARHHLGAARGGLADLPGRVGHRGAGAPALVRSAALSAHCAHVCRHLRAGGPGHGGCALFLAPR